MNQESPASSIEVASGEEARADGVQASLELPPSPMDGGLEVEGEADSSPAQPAEAPSEAELALRDSLLEEYVADWAKDRAADPNTSTRLSKHFRGELADVHGAAVAKASASATVEIEAALAAVASGDWPALDDCIPPGSLLEAIDEAFVATSDVPREIPLFATMHYVSALLLQSGGGLRTSGGFKRPDLWSVVLAPSGSGKTFGLNEISYAFGEGVDIFPQADSDRQFAENLSEHNLALFACDEFAQFLAEIGKGGTMPKTKGYLLKCGEGGVVEYNTRSTAIRLENPGLTIFGATVIDTFKKHLGYNSIVDGLAQRFGFVFAERDPERRKLAEYTFREDRAPAIGKAWRELLACSDPSRTCFLPPPATAAYQRAFEMLLARAELIGVDEGYSRRLSARGQKYALIYHFLQGKESEFIDAEDLVYGMRVAALHLRDTRRLLDMFVAEGAPASPASEREHLVAAVAACLRRARDNGAPPVDARKLLQSVKKVKGGELARDLMRQAVAEDPSLAPFADASPPKPGAIGQKRDVAAEPPASDRR